MRDQIPHDWTGDHALNFVAFLETVLDAVWARHGPAILAALRRQGEDAFPVTVPHHLSQPPGDIGELLPF